MSLIISGIIAPIGLAWINGDGWLQRNGFRDDTSSSIMFMCGGFSGFIGNLMLGPRLSVFDDDKGKTHKGSVAIRKFMERKRRVEVPISSVLQQQ